MGIVPQHQQVPCLQHHVPLLSRFFAVCSVPSIETAQEKAGLMPLLPSSPQLNNPCA